MGDLRRETDTAGHTSPPPRMRALSLQSGENDRAHLVEVLGVRSAVAVNGTVEQRLAPIARHQRGRVARRQILAAGIASSTIRRLVRHHRLLPRHRCVYLLGHDAPVDLDEETAVLLALRPGAALSHGRAAWLWNLAPQPPEAIHVTTAVTKSAAPGGVAIHRSRTLQPRDLRIRRGLPLTSPARTLLDHADQLTDRRLELAFDRAIVERILRPSELDELLARTQGRAAAPRLRALLEAERSPALTRSEAEERLLDLLRQAGLPPAQVNQRLLGYEADFHWPAQRLVVEIDGFRFHSTRQRFERDRRRDAQLRAAGLTTIRVTWRQLENEAYAVVARIATTLANPDRITAGPPT